MVVVRQMVPQSSSLRSVTSPMESLRQRLFTSKGSPRKNLFGVFDIEANLKFADKILQESQSEFINKWSFDPVEGKPLSSGQYEWKLLGKGHPPKPPDGDGEAKNCERNRGGGEEAASRTMAPVPASVIAPLIHRLDIGGSCGSSEHRNDENSRVAASNPSSSASSCERDSKKSPLPSDKYKSTKRLKQKKITDYGRITKSRSPNPLKQIQKLPDLIRLER